MKTYVGGMIRDTHRGNGELVLDDLDNELVEPFYLSRS